MTGISYAAARQADEDGNRRDFKRSASRRGQDALGGRRRGRSPAALFVPVNRLAETFFKGRSCLKAKFTLCLFNVETPTWLAIRFRWVPADFAREPGKFRDQLHQIAN